ncbi:amidase signature domain-containing protein [Aspergillus cavernicola]|uniref:Amidase signature domain-containing protein n=1 Tax=Aspergillus cavernicola TaxID=176166 RepID=A0ABR4J1H3_9EURO
MPRAISLQNSLCATVFLAAALYTLFRIAHSTPTSVIMGSSPSIDVLTADVRLLAGLLAAKKVTSRSLVDVYIAQIQRHDERLHAMIQITPQELLMRRADELDEERAAGQIRGPLHGIPIIIKDTVATHPSLGLPTTAGSLALLDSKPRKNARIVDMLLASGAIILGKSNLSEFSNTRGSMMPSGWSAVGGQTQSAYVRGGLLSNDSKDGHSSPSGSSAGSAVAVSAGYSPVSIGAETDGSLICPAGRAALYTMKPTIGLVPGEGIVPVSSNFDSAGPMTKSVYDLAVVLDSITERDVSSSYTTYMTGGWEDISVAVLDPTEWKFPENIVKPVPEATDQILRDINAAYDTINLKAKHFARNVPLVSVDKFELDGENSENLVTNVDLKRELNAYLEDLAESQVRSLQDILHFNEHHEEQELPPHHPRQDNFQAAQDLDVSQETYARHLEHLRHVAREEGIDHIFKTHHVDVIIGPADSFITSLATGSGYPIAGMPLSYLDYNGRPLGLAAIAGKGQEGLLIKVLSAWEATFPPRQPPAALKE